MIDFIKIYTTEKEELETNVKDMFTDVRCSLDYATGQILYPCKKYVQNIEVRLTEKVGIIRNSLHKFFNLETENSDNNHSDFNYNNLLLSIDLLSENLQTVLADYKVTNLEFGLNIEVSQSPKFILQNNIPMFNFDEFTQIDTFGNKGFYKQYNRSQYYIKMYDKGLQYKLNRNLMRIEVKIIDSEKLKDLGIYCFSDIKKKRTLENLFEFLMKCVDEVNIIDSFAIKPLSSKDWQFLELGKSPSYWRQIKQMKSKTEYYQQRKKYNMLLEYYNLNTLKIEIIELLNKKFLELLNPTV